MWCKSLILEPHVTNPAHILVMGWSCGILSQFMERDVLVPESEIWLFQQMNSACTSHSADVKDGCSLQGTLRVNNCQKAAKYEVADVEKLVIRSRVENTPVVPKHLQ